MTLIQKVRDYYDDPEYFPNIRKIEKSSALFGTRLEQEAGNLVG